MAQTARDCPGYVFTRVFVRSSVRLSVYLSSVRARLLNSLYRQVASEMFLDGWGAVIQFWRNPYGDRHSESYLDKR